jgi:hypothetical protein
LDDSQRYIIEDLLHYGESERGEIGRRHRMGVNEIQIELHEIKEKTGLVNVRMLSGTTVMWSITKTEEKRFKIDSPLF